MLIDIHDGDRSLRLGARVPPVVIAELSGNHKGELDRALALIQAAADSGAPMVKLQTYTADTITMDSPHPSFAIEEGPWAGRRLYELYQEASTPWEWHPELFAEARRLGMIPFSSPFDPTAVDLLEDLDCPIYKVASFEVVDIPLLEAIGRTGKPVIMSTGMASLAEIETALAALRLAGSSTVMLLHCISQYPTDPGTMRLANLAQLGRTFGCCAGLSDHSLGHHIASAAIALGACVIEKHLTLSRADGGPDASFSMEPTEFAALVRSVAEVYTALIDPVGFGLRKEDQSSRRFRKSIYVARDLAAGATLTPEDLRVVRPAAGLAPIELKRVIGRQVRHEVSAGDPLTWDLLR